MRQPFNFRVQGLKITHHKVGIIDCFLCNSTLIIELVVQKDMYYVCELKKPDAAPPRFTITCLRRILDRFARHYGEKPIHLYASGRLNHDTVGTSSYEARQSKLVMYYESKGFVSESGCKNEMKADYKVFMSKRKSLRF